MRGTSTCDRESGWRAVLHRTVVSARRSVVAMIAVLAVMASTAAGCSSDDETSAVGTDVPGTSGDGTSTIGTDATGTSDEAGGATAEPGDVDETTTGGATSGTDGAGSTAAGSTAASETTVASIGQAVVWPSPGAGAATPGEAAEDFVTTVLGVPAVLGEFQAGDARSGEIDVFSPGEGEGAIQILRGVLVLRQLGPPEGWYVIAAENPNAAITTPAAGATVPAAPLAVDGAARGFEASVVVSAYVAGGGQLDQVITQGGAFEEPEPFSVSIDLSNVSPGDNVMLLVRGGTGLETDPGEFGAIPVTIG